VVYSLSGASNTTPHPSFSASFAMLSIPKIRHAFFLSYYSNQSAGRYIRRFASHGENVANVKTADGV
jgi:hypothetical protein